MTCQERIQALEQSVETLEQHLQELRAMPGSGSDPAILAAIAETQAALTAVRIQLANEKASCDETAEELPAARSLTVRNAQRELRKIAVAQRKAVLAASKEIRRNSKALINAIDARKTRKAAPKKASKKNK